MPYTDTDEINRTRLPVYVAIADVNSRNSRNQDLYTHEQQRTAQEFYSRVGEAYFRSKVYCNYRERFIAIKVTRNPYDQFERDVMALDAWCEENDVKITRKGTTVIYRIIKRDTA